MLHARCFTSLLLSRSATFRTGLHHSRASSSRFYVARQLDPGVASRLTLMVLFAYDTEISILSQGNICCVCCVLKRNLIIILKVHFDNGMMQLIIALQLVTEFRRKYQNGGGTCTSYNWRWFYSRQFPINNIPPFMPLLIFWSGSFAVLDDHFSVLDYCGPTQYVTKLKIKFSLFLH